MKNASIATNLSIEGTTVTIDGKNLTDSGNVISIYFHASSPAKDSEYDTGYIYLDVTTQDENGNIETKSYRKKSSYDNKKVPLGKTMNDVYGGSKVEDFIGVVSKNKTEIIDKIVSKAEAKGIKVDKEVLKLRSIDSLQDKLNDME